jgi:hypothetical protein
MWDSFKEVTMRIRIRTVSCAVSAAIVLTLPLNGQAIQGVIVNAASNQPVADASVVLLDSKGEIRRGTLSEMDGFYTLPIPENGTYSIRVGGAGFLTWDSPPTKLRTDQVMELHVRLTSSQMGADPSDFHRRRNLGRGTFITAADVEERGGERFTDVLRNRRGMVVLPLPRSSGYNTVRLLGSHIGAENAGARQRLEGGSDCPPVLFVDGKWWGSIDEASDMGPDFALLPVTVAAIEVYNKADVPEEFDTGQDARCGVIVVWRKAGEGGR